MGGRKKKSTEIEIGFGTSYQNNIRKQQEVIIDTTLPEGYIGSSAIGEVDGVEALSIPGTTAISNIGEISKEVWKKERIKLAMKVRGWNFDDVVEKYSKGQRIKIRV